MTDSSMVSPRSPRIDRRRVLQAGAVAGGAAWVAPSLTSVAVAQAPGTGEPAAAPSVRGTGKLDPGDGHLVTLAVSATGGHSPSGTVDYTRSSGTFSGTVDCVIVNGTDGTVVGTITTSSGDYAGHTSFLVGIRDGAPDLARVAVRTFPYDCVAETVFPSTVVEGDFVVSP